MKSKRELNGFSETYVQLKRLSPVLNTFMVCANDIAREMLYSNQKLVGIFPPLYQNILTQSRKIEEMVLVTF